MNKSKIDYLAHSERLIGRVGYSHNIITGCKHHESDICNIDCYARRMVEHGRLKGSKSYPYGFAPTFHPERVRGFGGKPKLIFLNDMGDCGGDWNWKMFNLPHFSDVSPKHITHKMLKFANLNPQHIILLLTKNPSWYGYQEWPDNVWCGFTATNNTVLDQRWNQYNDIDWISCEPWLDDYAPRPQYFRYLRWAVIGGLTGRRPQGVSDRTKSFIANYPDHLCPLFVKDNARLIKPVRQYPREWNLLLPGGHDDENIQG